MPQSPHLLGLHDQWLHYICTPVAVIGKLNPQELFWLNMISRESEEALLVIRDQSILVLVSPIFLSGNSFFLTYHAQDFA